MVLRVWHLVLVAVLAIATVGIALATAISSSEPGSETIQMPTSADSTSTQVVSPATTPNPDAAALARVPVPPTRRPSASTRHTIPFHLTSGKTVRVSRICADLNDLGSKKLASALAADALPAPKQAALNAGLDLHLFLNQHPEHDLAPSVYTTYKSLRGRYDAAIRAFNAKVETYNADARAVNAVLKKCEL